MKESKGEGAMIKGPISIDWIDGPCLRLCVYVCQTGRQAGRAKERGNMHVCNLFFFFFSFPLSSSPSSSSSSSFTFIILVLLVLLVLLLLLLLLVHHRHCGHCHCHHPVVLHCIVPFFFFRQPSFIFQDHPPPPQTADPARKKKKEKKKNEKKHAKVKCLVHSMLPTRAQRNPVIQSPPTPPSLPPPPPPPPQAATSASSATVPDSASTAFRTSRHSRSALHRPSTIPDTDTVMVLRSHHSDPHGQASAGSTKSNPGHSAQGHGRRHNAPGPRKASSSSSSSSSSSAAELPSSASAVSAARKPTSTTFSLAPMTTTTVVTTTTTTSTEYPPLFFSPPPIPAHLDPKVFPLADTPTPPALKKFCFDLNGQPTFFRENQDGEKTMDQLEDALYNLSASAHQRALKSMSEQATKSHSNSKSRSHASAPRDRPNKDDGSGAGLDQTMTTVARTSVNHPQQDNLSPHVAWRSHERCRAKKRPASPITPVGTVDVSVPSSTGMAGSLSTLSTLSHSHLASGSAQRGMDEASSSFVGRSSPPHKKSKRPWTTSYPVAEGSEVIRQPMTQKTAASRKLPSSTSAPSLAEFATPALPTRTRTMERAREQNIQMSRLAPLVDPSSLPSPSLSPTTASQNSSHSAMAQHGADGAIARRRFRTAPTSFHTTQNHEEDEHSLDRCDHEVHGRQEDEEEDDDEETINYMSDDGGEEEGQDLEADEEMDVERSLQQAGLTHVPTLLDLPNLIATFDALPSSLQSYMLFHLLRRSPAPTLQFVSSVILATMKQDFLSLLPVELSRNVLRFLDGKSLCKAAQVSKQWRIVVDSDAHIWMHQFQKEGFVLDDREEEDAFAQRLGIDGHYGVRPSYQDRKLLAKRRLAKGKGRSSQAVIRASDLPESPVYPNDVTMLGEDEVEGSLPPSSMHRGRESRTHEWDSDTAEDDGQNKEDNFMTPDAAPPSPTTSHTGRFNDADSEDEMMEQELVEEPFGPMAPSTAHPFKALYRRHWIIRQNWRKGRAKYIQFKGHIDKVVTCLQFDSEKIISGYDDQSIHVYDTATGNRLKQLVGHEGGVWALQYHGNTLVSGATDRTVRVWDIEKGICTHTFRGHSSTVRCLQIVMPINVNKDPNGVPKYEPEFPVIVTGSRDSTLLVWRLPDPELNGHISPTDGSWLLHSLVGHTLSVRALAAEGSTLVSGSYDCTVRVWNICTGALVHRLQGHTQKVYSIVLDRERNQCMSGSMDAVVRIWSLEDGTCLHMLEGHASLVGLLGLNANHLVSAAADFTVRVWDPERGVCLRILTGHAAAITCFQHDGNKVISGSDGNLKMWDFKTGKFIRNLLTGLSSVWQVKFDERRCVAAVKRVEPNGSVDETYFEVLDYGIYGIVEPLENAPILPLEDGTDNHPGQGGAAGAEGGPAPQAQGGEVAAVGGP